MSEDYEYGMELYHLFNGFLHLSSNKVLELRFLLRLFQVNLLEFVFGHTSNLKCFVSYHRNEFFCSTVLVTIKINYVKCVYYI